MSNMIYKVRPRSRAFPASLVNMTETLAQRRRHTHRSQTRTALLVFFAVLTFLFYHNSFASRPARKHQPVFKGKGHPRVAKVSMLYGNVIPLYERALRSHDVHNERFNYPFHVLRYELAGGYWNKPSYLMSLVVNELAKPPEERVEWLMWVDADLVIINPSIPLEVFLPPEDFSHIHFVANKDHNGLNTGTFFIKVHEWSVKMLAKALAFPLFQPDVDLHTSVDQEAMQHVFNETDFSSNIIFQPRPWFNTYEWHHAYEGKLGNLLVHFPGLEDDRWRHMDAWLKTVEQYPHKWDVPLEDTFYPNATATFWDAARTANRLILRAENLILYHKEKLNPDIEHWWERAKRALLFAADDTPGLVKETEGLKQILIKHGISTDPDKMEWQLNQEKEDMRREDARRKQEEQKKKDEQKQKDEH